LDAFTDKHDNAEDATYFEPAIKQQLRLPDGDVECRAAAPDLQAQEALPYE